MKWLSRFSTITFTVYRFGLTDLVRHNLYCQRGVVKWLLWLFPRSFASKQTPLPERVRLALENLGPVFVKFGQMLSTRRDLLPADYADELAILQDQVPPFDGALAQKVIEKSFKKTLEEIYFDFDLTPVASASVAQVHSAYLKNPDGSRGEKVAVKVLRPDIKPIIEQDLALMRVIARWVARLFADGRRLRPVEVVEEFDKHLHDELDLMNEAASASQFGRQFKDHKMLLIPKVYFDFTSREVFTMQWMDGIPVSDIEQLKQKNIDLKKLAVTGVELFFTQVFDTGFFHADMHPGNILVTGDGRYIALDFGIVGGLTDFDKRYLAINFLAFFNHDYHRVATAHIESGWVDQNVRVNELEAAIRTVCEPIFDKPLAEISFGIVLMRLFEVSRRFNVQVQPQLVLLEKTLLNIEGLGRQLDPELDLWATAKPFLVRWTNKQVGIRGFFDNIKREVPEWVRDVPTFPRKINQLFEQKQQQEVHWQQSYLHLLTVQKKQTFWLSIIALILLVHIIWLIWSR